MNPEVVTIGLGYIGLPTSALIASHGYYGSSGLYSMHTERAHAERACSHTMACSLWGWVPAEVLQPALPPPQMGWCAVRRGWGEHPVVCTPCIP